MSALEPDEALGPQHLGLWYPDPNPPLESLPGDDLRVLWALRRAEQIDRASGITYSNWSGGVTLTDDTLERGKLDPAPAPEDIVVVTLEEFVGVDESGAGALLGTGDAALIPEGGDVMVFGDGGAGKTTLAVDLAFHLAAGDDWLEIPVPKPRRVLLIENEGPRALLRKKLGRKRDAWAGGDLGGRLRVFERPWGDFTLASEQWRNELARKVAALEVDVLIVGPLTRIGMDVAGTLQDVAAFMRVVAELRVLCGRPLTVILVHHENKPGAVSGAWEGSGDTLLHIQAAGNGHTILHIQKARWDAERHGKTLRLAWADGEGFKVEGERDRLAEIKALLADDRPRTLKEIAAPREKGGIGANLDDVRDLVEGNAKLFESFTGDDAKALGRHPSAVVWKVTRAPSHPSHLVALRGVLKTADS